MPQHYGLDSKVKVDERTCPYTTSRFTLAAFVILFYVLCCFASLRSNFVTALDFIPSLHSCFASFHSVFCDELSLLPCTQSGLILTTRARVVSDSVTPEHLGNYEKKCSHEQARDPKLPAQSANSSRSGDCRDKSNRHDEG